MPAILRHRRGTGAADAGADVEMSHAPVLMWFDLVLADLGDSQSLQQSLSTFSGHVRRVQAVLAAATPHSLLLLDEVHFISFLQLFQLCAHSGMSLLCAHPLLSGGCLRAILGCSTMLLCCSKWQPESK